MRPKDSTSLWHEKVHQRISTTRNNLGVSEIGSFKLLKDILSFMTLFHVATQKSHTVLLRELA